MLTGTVHFLLPHTSFLGEHRPDPNASGARAEAVRHEELAILVHHHLRPGYRDVLHYRFLTSLSVAETAAAMVHLYYVRFFWSSR
jgi:hypothetical protein